MRPVPQSRHLLATLLLAAAAAFYGYLAFNDDRLSDSQEYTLTGALKLLNPDLLAHDAIYGLSGLWRLESPLFQHLMLGGLELTGPEDLTLPLRWAVGPVTLVFLLGMYLLLWSQTHSWSVSVVVAIMSATVTPAIGGASWGVGSLGSITASGLVMALVPWVALAFLRFREDWRLIPLMGAAGLLANLAAATAMNLVLVLLLTYVMRHRREPKAWLRAGASGLAAAAAALPYAWRYFVLAERLAVGAGRYDVQAAHEALAGWGVMYPQVLGELLSWPLFLFLLVVPTALVLYRIERFSIPGFAFWSWLLAAVIFVALVLHGLGQLLAQLLGQRPPVVMLVWASALAMLPMYVMLAQIITSLFRLTRQNRQLVRWAVAALVLGWVIPSANFRVARYAVLETINVFVDERAKLRRVQHNRLRLQRKAELAAIGMWARSPEGAHPEAVFLCHEVAFRVAGRRSIVAGRDDLFFLFRFAPWELGRWKQRVDRQSALLFAPAGPDGRAIAGYIRGLTAPAGPGQPASGEAAATHYAAVPEWYVVYPGLEESPNDPYIEPVFLGRFRTVFRVHLQPRPPADAAAAATTTAPTQPATPQPATTTAPG